MVTAFDGGKVLNQKTAPSQAMDGIVMGVGMALLEHTVRDSKRGRVVTRNLADYLVPVNADVPEIEVRFTDRPDYVFNPTGARGSAKSASPEFPPRSPTLFFTPSVNESANCR